MIKRILIGIGGTPFTAVAIRRAVDLAALHRAQVTAVTVVDEARLRQVGPVPLGGGAAASSLRLHRMAVTREKIDAAIASLETQCTAQNVPLTVLREDGDPCSLLRDHARYHDLMVFGLRSMFEYDVFAGDDVDPVLGCSGRSRIASTLFGSTALHVLRNASCPLFFN